MLSSATVFRVTTLRRGRFEGLDQGPHRAHVDIVKFCDSLEVNDGKPMATALDRCRQD
jgi:hypothetical protein